MRIFTKYFYLAVPMYGCDAQVSKIRYERNEYFSFPFKKIPMQMIVLIYLFEMRKCCRNNKIQLWSILVYMCDNINM